MHLVLRVDGACANTFKTRALLLVSSVKLLAGLTRARVAESLVDISGGGAT